MRSGFCLSLQALNYPSQRVDLLQQLLADIALEIDDRARGTALQLVACCNAPCECHKSEQFLMFMHFIFASMFSS